MVALVSLLVRKLVRIVKISGRGDRDARAGACSPAMASIAKKSRPVKY